jgi:hypothetical protein
LGRTFGAGAGGDRAAHVRREEREADLVRGVHPAEALAGDHLEVDALVAVLGVDEVREFDGVELHPARATFVSRGPGRQMRRRKG